MLSVIIPAHKGAPRLASLLCQLDGPLREGGLDVVLSSSGQNIEVIKTALRHGAYIALGREGRGWQLARGARFSQARYSGFGQGESEHDRPEENKPKPEQPWLLFLHSDSRLPQNWQAIIESHITHHSHKAGYFSLKFDDEGFWPRCIEAVVALRCAVLALPYGDQGLLIRADHYEACGGFKQWDLFEDVQIVRDIGRGRLRALGAPLMTDASKYRRDGYMKRSMRNVILLCKFLCGANPQKLMEQYH